MDKLTQIRVFVRVAERRSFSAVARDLDVTQSAVSKAVAALERALGVQLVSRSTRTVALTEAGNRYYERCRQILCDLDEAEAAVNEIHNGTNGTLKIAAPVPFGLMFISPRVARFKKRYPALEIDLDLSDRHSNLVEESVDVAIRLGPLDNPGVVARKLGNSPFVAVASTAYLSSRGTPRVPQDLVSHNCVTYTHQANPSEWMFEGPAASSITVMGSYRSNNLLALKDAAIAGIGIARLPLWMVDAEIRSGALRVVLEDYTLPAYEIHAVFPSVRRVPVKVKLFVEFIQDELRAISYFLGTRSAGDVVSPGG